MSNLGLWRRLAMGKRYSKDLMNWQKGLKSCTIVGI